MIVLNLMELLAEAIGNPPNHPVSVNVDTVNSKYASDIEALKAVSRLTPGSVVEIDLQEILKLCPRKRRRVSAYDGLVSYLMRQHVTLVIKSNKTKRNEKKSKQEDCCSRQTR